MKLPRRHFLRGAGAVLAVPMLRSLLPREAWAADEVAPKRVLFFIQDNGTLRDEWAPLGPAGTNYTLPYMLEPLESVKSELVVIAGIDNHITASHSGNAHDIGNATLLTGIERTDAASVQTAPNGGGISLDQYLSTRLPRAPRSSVNINMPGGTFTISYSGRQQPVTGMRLENVFDDLFGNFNGSTDAGVLARRKRTRESVIDSVLENFKHVNNRVSIDDKRKLDHHLSVLRDLEQRLALEAQGAACNPVKSPTNPFPQYAASLYAMAFACQLTHVGAYQALDPEWERNATIHFSGGYHNFVHQGPDFGLDPVRRREDWRTTMRWFSSSFAMMVNQFKNTPDVGGTTLLDNSLVVWLNTFGMGTYHDFYEMPVVLAGKAGGTMRTGRYLDYRGARTSRPTNYYGNSYFVNETHNNLMVSICNAMGLDDVSSFGDPAFCSGGLPGLV